MLERLKRLWSAPPAATAPVASAGADWKRRGNDLLAQGQLAQAAQAYRRAAEADPSDAAALVNLGFALLEDGQAEEARTALAAALRIEGQHHEAEFLQARANRALGALEPARAGFARATQLAPQFEHAWLELADVHAQLGDRAAAHACLRDAARAHPESVAVGLRWAAALLERDEVAQAHGVFQRLLALEGGNVEALLGCGYCAMREGDAGAALALIDRALALDASSPLGHLNRANALLGLQREEEAIASLQTALQLQPDYVEALVNMGGALQRLNRLDEAIRLYDQALALAPGQAAAQWNRGLCHLLLGHFAQGWIDNECRWRALGTEMTRVPAPQWTGREPIAGKAILVHAEQGLGDAIQFVRYAALLAARGAVVWLQVPAALARLMAAVPGVRGIVRDGEPLPAVDFHCPMLSLPQAFGTDLPSIPWDAPYLAADPADAAAWRERVGNDGRLRVGLVWAGNPRHVNDRNRSMALRDLLAALSVEGVRLYAVQKDASADDLAALAAAGVEDLGSGLRDFADTAGLLSCLDLLVTVDTSMAHLAGALGLEAWVLLPFHPDWRWMLARADTPWYPSLALLRQQRLRDWAAPLAQARSQLQQRAAGQARRRGNAALQEGRLDDAQACYREALATDPADIASHVNLAFVLLEQQRPGDASALLQHALALPAARAFADAQDAWFLLGQARQQEGQPGAAVAAYEQALRLRPDFAEALQALVLLAQQHYAHGQDAAVLAALEPVLRAQPHQAEALAGRGHALLRMGDYERAAQAFQLALAHHGASAQRLVDLASACVRLARHDEAARLVAEALAQEPGHATALNLRVVCLTEDLRLSEAEAAARDALRVHPEDADLHWSLAIALLLQGKLAEGWREHRWRWRTSVMATSAPAARAEPPWRGEPLAGRSIVLVSEQGLGDAIQCLRFVPAVARLAGRVLVQAHPKLHGLLADLPPNCEVLDPATPVRADLHCALMDLPEGLGTQLEELGQAVPYLRADPAKVAHWTPRVRDGSPRLHVGLAWSGNAAHTNDRQRSIPLARFADLLSADARFVAVQTDLRASDQAAADALPLVLEPSRALDDFADTAAMLAALDLVITVDSSVAHLAGALGRPTWLLLPYCPDWRWMVGRDDSPWYPGMRLFRQPRRGDWETVLRNVRVALARRIDAQ